MTQRSLRTVLMMGAAAFVLTSCADADGPKARSVNIPAPKSAEARQQALNERPDPVIYLPLGKDVLLPEMDKGDPLPDELVGPFELRGETLAGALQLVLDGADIPIAFESDESLARTVTVTNLRGPLNEVVHEICSLANQYCAYQNGILVVKNDQIFTVTIPPIAATDQLQQFLTNISTAVASITGSTPVTDPSTRTIVYRASQRTSMMAQRYFQRLRQSTALIIFETYIWEVSLNSGNSTGIRWDELSTLGKFNVGINLAGSANAELGAPVSIGLPTTGNINFTTSDVVQFISNYGAVKTISQPQITMLSGSSSRLRVADRQNFLSSISQTVTDGGNTTTSTTTDQVNSGFTLEIGSNWDSASVYSNINIELSELKSIERFEASPEATVQLPNTTERELRTSVRVRPGDTLLLAGLVRESDNLDSTGPGIAEPIIPTSRTAGVSNVELVFMLRPRVIVFTSEDQSQDQAAKAPAPPPVPEATKMETLAPLPEEVLRDDDVPPPPPPVEKVEKKAAPVTPTPATPAKSSTTTSTPRVVTNRDIPALRTEKTVAPTEMSDGVRYSDAPVSNSPPSPSASSARTSPPPAAVERVTEPFAEVPLNILPPSSSNSSQGQ